MEKRNFAFAGCLGKEFKVSLLWLSDVPGVQGAVGGKPRRQQRPDACLSWLRGLQTSAGQEMRMTGVDASEDWVLWWCLMDDPKGRAGAGALPGLFANCERGGQGSNIFYTWYNTIDTIYRYIWIYIRCKKMRGRPSTRVASSCAPCSTSPAQEMCDHCKTCHEHIVGKYAPAIF